MGRKHYETEQDLAEENSAAMRLAQHIGGVQRKLSNAHYSKLDRVVYDAKTMKVLAFAEIKRRKHNYGTFPTLLLSAGKWADALNMSDALRIPFILYVAYNDCDAVLEYNPSNARTKELLDDKGIWVEWGGRTSDTRDDGDIEPVVMIPMKYLRVLPALPPKPEISTEYPF